MLETLFGSKNRERVLQFILANGEGYAKEIADFYNTSLDPVQKQLEKLELGGVLVSKNVGRTRLFMFNPRYAFLDELKSLLSKARSYYEPEEIERLTMRRKRPRRANKPLVRPLKSIKEMSMEELAGYVCSQLEKEGIKTVLSGGSCVEIYSQGKYTSDDIDLIDRFNGGHTKIKNVIIDLGFKEHNRYFVHKETPYFIEFPRGPLGVGDAPVKNIASRENDTGILRLLTPTDCIKDRLAAYYHWDDPQSLEQAVWVAEQNEFDMVSVERWSKGEGELKKFEVFKDRVKNHLI